MQETPIRFLGWEDTLEKGKATHPIILGFSLVVQWVKNPPAMQETWVHLRWVGKISWRRERLPTPAFWPGEFHGLYSLWGLKRVRHD